jgi:acyl-CoA synthetase (AMP-forming)/AMP-acid ligase II
MAETTLFVSGGQTKGAPVVLNVSKNSLEGNQIRSVAQDCEDARQIVSCGHVSEGLAVAVVDPETFLPCSPRRVGEIWISGSSVAKGYWNRPEETKKAFHAYLANTGEGPFLRSGDLGFVQDGELFITGRSKDLIIING